MRNKFLQLMQVFKFCLFNILRLLLLVRTPSSSIWRIRPDSTSQWTKNFPPFFLTIWRAIPKNHASIWQWLCFNKLVLINKLSILYIVQLVLTELVFSLLHFKVGQKWVFCWTYRSKTMMITKTYLTICIYGFPTTIVWC